MRRLRHSVLVATIIVAFSIGSSPALGQAPRDAAIRGRVPANAASVASGSPAPGAAVSGRFLVKVRPTGKTALAAIDAVPGVSATDVKVGPHRTATVRTPKGKSDAQFLRELRASPDIEYAEPNYIRKLAAYAVPPNDPYYNSSDGWFFGGVTAPIFWGRSWWLRDANANGGMNVASLWDALDAPTFPARATGSDIKVAVIDSGFYSTHPDAGSNILAGKDEFNTYASSTGLTTDGDVTPADPNAPLNDIPTASHGTCVAGQISAGTDNGIGVAGVSYDSTVLVYKVLGIWTDGDPADGYPAGSAVIFDEAVINAIYDATDAGVKVINMSLAGPDYSAGVQSAVDYAWAHGVLVVAANGNTGTLNGVQYPAANNHVVGVGSYVVDGPSNASPPTFKRRSYFSDYGVGGDPSAGANNGRLDILAPGEGVWGLVRPDYDNDGAGSDIYEPGYFWWKGTSMASPAFAGVAAMMWRFAPALTPDELATAFFATGVNAGSDLGYGFVNPTAAYAKLKTDYPYLLAPATLSMPPSTVSPVVPLSWSAVAGRSVTYDIADNTVFQKNVTGTSTTLSLGPGSHIVSVTPRSAYNWWSPATFRSGTVVVDSSLDPVTLTGAVNSDGNPLSGVSVSVPGATTVVTSPGGTYSVVGIFPGTHSVTYSKAGYASQTITVVVTADPATTTQDVAMVETVTLNGTVTVNGNPLSGVSVSVPGTTTVTTLPNGTYTVGGISPGTHSVTYSKTGYDSQTLSVGVTADPATTTQNVAMVAQTVTVTGVVTSSGNPLSGVSVSAPGATTVTTSPGGAYTVGGIFPGLYTFTYSKAGYASQTIAVQVTSDPTTTTRNVAMGTLTPIYRFFNKQSASHFYTASAAEKDSVIANLSATYALDGVAYRVSSVYATPLHRFYNKVNGSHFYTATEAEKNDVIANLASTYTYDGVAYRVSRTSVAGSTPVYRFFNKQNASHFYTASVAEKNGVVANLSATYALDGVAFYVTP